MAKETQQSRASALETLSALWDPYWFGHTALRNQAQNAVQRAYADYFSKSTWVFQWEQALPSFTIMLAVCGLWLRIRSKRFGGAMLGPLAILLPRLQQTFQNFHNGLSSYLNFQTAHERFRRLVGWFEDRSATLPEDFLSHAPLHIFCLTSNQSFSGRPMEFVESLKQQPFQRGYWRVSGANGANGAGKSTLLRWIKLQLKEAALLGPHLQLFNGGSEGSTGERQCQQLEKLFLETGGAAEPPILLLDEWDANLDPIRRRWWRDRITAASTKRTIIEACPHVHTG